MNQKTIEFYAKLSQRSREELLDLIDHQDPPNSTSDEELTLREQIELIEHVFATKMTHLTWNDGTPVEGREFTNLELAYMIDPPFHMDPELTQLGFDEKQQRDIHIASDRVLWAKHILKANPRAYQILVLRHPSLRKVLRWGRRLGKTWVMAVTLLHYSYTTSNGRCLVMAPMKSQVKIIFEECLKLASKSLEVQDAIDRHPQSPQYEIYFTNGATVRFFTTGMKSGGKSDVARGQEAHVIILDEMDYMGSEDTTALYAMLQRTDANQPQKMLLAASTPSGRREKFWEWCFPQGNLVTTQDGMKQIETIKANDLVLDAYGGIDRVVESFSRNYEGEVVTLQVNAFPPIESTSEHPHLVLRDGEEVFLPAKEIKVGDSLKIPNRPIRPLVPLDFSDYLSSKYDVIPEMLEQSIPILDIAQKLSITTRTVNYRLAQFRKNGYFCDTRRIQSAMQAETLYKQILDLNDLTALGLYLAEGHITKDIQKDTEYIKGVCWTFAKHENNHAQSCMEFVKDLGLRSRFIDKSHIDSTIQVEVDSCALGLLFKTLFNEKDSKRVPSFIDHMPRPIQETFIKGVVDGDGHYDTNGSWTLRLTAYEAIYDLFYLMRRHGHDVRMYAWKPVSNRRRVWSLRFNVSAEDKQPITYVPIVRVSTRIWEGTVYNFQTEKTNTYVVEGYATHNCVKKKRYKEWWFPSYVNPNWTAEDEEEQREANTEMGYRHEIEADWGEDTEGVYPRKFVDRAFLEPGWKYHDRRQNPDSLYLIGVDWDKFGAGPNIVVLEVGGPNHPDERFRDKLHPVFRYEIPKSEFVLTEMVDMIINLNMWFNPEHIYVDRGSGEVQVELLHKWGIEHPETGLRKKVKGVSFSETLEVRDPATKQIEKKHIKPFMVENLRNLMEKEKIVFPIEDDELYMQLISYVVVRINESGRPVFEASGTQKDHAHDALILACLAYTQNYDELLKTRVARFGMVLPSGLIDSTVIDDGKGGERFKTIYGDKESGPMKRKRALVNRPHRSYVPIVRKKW